MGSIGRTRHIIRIAAAALALALAGASGPIEAGPDADGIAEATDQIILNWQHPAQGTSLIARGRTRAEPVAGGWRLTLPPLDWVGAKQERLRLSGLVMLLEPVDGERVRINLKLPMRVPVLDRSGFSLGQLTLGRQRIQGIWDRRLDGLVRLEMRLDRLSLSDRRGRETAHAATISLNARFEEAKGSSWRGAWSVDASDLRAEGVSLSALDLTGEAATMRLFDYARLAKAAGIDWRLGPQAAERAGLARRLPELIGPVGQQLSVNGFELTRADGAPLYRLDSAEAGLELKPEAGERVSGHLGYQHDGFETPLLVPEFLPAKLELDLDLAHVFAGALATLFEKGPAAALKASGGRLTVKRATAENDRLRLDLDGSLAAPQPGAPYSGRLDASLAGLDGSAPRNHLSLSGRSMTPLVLMAIRGMGRPRLGPDRRMLYDYRLDLAEDGRLTVNGHDLTQLKALLAIP